MKKEIVAALVAGLIVSGTVAGAAALTNAKDGQQPTDAPSAATPDRHGWTSMTPEQRRERFEQRRQEWLSKLSPEERKEMEDAMAARKKFFDSLSPEQKELWKQMRQHRPHHGGFGRQHGHHGRFGGFGPQ